MPQAAARTQVSHPQVNRQLWQDQNQSVGFVFQDNRSEALQLKGFQQQANQSPRVLQLMAYQQMANLHKGGAGPAQLKPVIQRESYDSTWDEGSGKFSKSKRQGIKAEIQLQFAELKKIIDVVEDGLKGMGISLPKNSELAKALSALKFTYNQTISFRDRNSIQTSLKSEIPKAKGLTEKIKTLLASPQIKEIAKMQNLEGRKAQRKSELDINSAAGSWVGKNAKKFTMVPTVGKSKIDISSLLALKNSKDSYHKKPYQNWNKYLAAGGNYTELKLGDDGKRVILDDDNVGCYWYGYGITHLKKSSKPTMYYWDGSRWHKWDYKNHLAIPYEQEKKVDVSPDLDGEDKEWLKANKSGLTGTLNKISNPKRTAKQALKKKPKPLIIEEEDSVETEESVELDLGSTGDRELSPGSLSVFTPPDLSVGSGNVNARRRKPKSSKSPPKRRNKKKRNQKSSAKTSSTSLTSGQKTAIGGIAIVGILLLIITLLNSL